MRLSPIEFHAMNNPVRRWVQEHVEFELFVQHLDTCGIDLKGKAILDVGCGSGYSSKLISNAFSPSKLTAFDFMPEQIERARRRDVKADFFVGNATDITLPSESFDAAFVFGVLHHIPAWKKAVLEIARVLKPGGVLLVEEPGLLLLNIVTPLRFKHPEEARFDWPEFEEAIKSAGFTILAQKKMWVNTFQSYLCKKM